MLYWVSTVLTLWLFQTEFAIPNTLRFLLLLLGIVLWSTEPKLITSILTISIWWACSMLWPPVYHPCLWEKDWSSQPLLKSITTLSIQVHFQLIIFKCQAMFEWYTLAYSTQVQWPTVSRINPFSLKEKKLIGTNFVLFQASNPSSVINDQYECIRTH